jgi:hypothetical protein
MRVLRSRFLLSLVVVALLAACQSADPGSDRPRGSAAPLPAGLETFWTSTLTPYPTPTKTTLPKAPDGFEPVFVENLARHGSRTLTDGELLSDSIKLWERAKREDALTSVGRRFGPDARALRSAMREFGFGELNTLGREEMRGIGAREGERLAKLFDDAPADGAKVEVLDSGYKRAKESAKSFSEGLASVHPDLAIEPTETNEDVLKFSGENDEYEKYLEDGPWLPVYYKLRRASGIDEAAVDALEYLYDPDFVAGIRNPLRLATGIFDVYRSGPANLRDSNVDTEPLMRPDVAEIFAYVDDGRYFYSRGPGIEGDDGAYQAARVMLDDFFSAIDDRLQGRGPHPHVAVYRFAHAEEMTPFAALLQVPGADEPGKPGELYTHKNNEFRVARIAPLSGNIQWIVWAKGDTHIVSIAQHERQTTVGRDCEPYEDTDNFYELEELRSCLGAA